MILGHPSQLTNKPSRIISLVPSQTELLHELGLENETVGITKFCVHPASWFQTKARVGGTKTIDLEKIRALQPDLVIANKEENIKEQVESLALNYPVWVTDVEDLPAAMEMIMNIGSLTGKEDKSRQLVTEIKNGFEKLEDHADISTAIPCAYLVWKDPYMTVGGDTFISDMLTRAGYKNVFGSMDRYPSIDIDAIRNSGAARLLLSSEPYPFSAKHVEELQLLLPGMKIQLVDGELFSWYGSRLLQAPVYFEKLRSDHSRS